MTHNQARVIACAELFARTSVKVLKGEKPVEGLQKSLEEMSDTFEIQSLVKAGLESRAKDTREVIAGFILGCSQGIENIPEQWLDDMVDCKKILWLMA